MLVNIQVRLQLARLYVVPYPHDWTKNQYVLFDSTSQKTASVNTPNATPQQTTSLNTIGLSPNNLATTIRFVRTISDELKTTSNKHFHYFRVWFT